MITATAAFSYYPRGVVTRKATDGDRWAVDDPVIQLRLRGEEHAFELPPSEIGTTLVVGAAEGCDLLLRDPSGCVSRHHADLVRERDGWVLHDRGSTNGIRQDGELRPSVHLAPGVEIDIGEIKLIAESRRLMVLRAYLSRIIGWERARIEQVDRAIQAVRTMATRRAALVLCGSGDLGGVARRLHDLSLGLDHPFIASPGIKLDPAIVGTYCFVDDDLPDDFAALAAGLGAAGSKARLIVCSPSREDATEAMAQLDRSAVLELPSLDTRAHEVERLILEYAQEAMLALGAPSLGFREHEPIWLRGIHLETLQEVEELTLRLVAMRNWGVTAGAHRVGISHVALSRWAQRRRIPT